MYVCMYIHQFYNMSIHESSIYRLYQTKSYKNQLFPDQDGQADMADVLGTQGKIIFGIPMTSLFSNKTRNRRDFSLEIIRPHIFLL